MSTQNRSLVTPWAFIRSSRNSRPARAGSAFTLKCSFRIISSRCCADIPRCRPLDLPSRLVRSHHCFRIRELNCRATPPGTIDKTFTVKGASSFGPRHTSNRPAESVTQRTSRGLLARTSGWQRRSFARIVVPLLPVPPLKIGRATDTADTLQTGAFQ